MFLKVTIGELMGIFVVIQPSTSTTHRRLLSVSDCGTTKMPINIQSINFEFVDKCCIIYQIKDYWLRIKISQNPLNPKALIPCLLLWKSLKAKSQKSN